MPTSPLNLLVVSHDAADRDVVRQAVADFGWIFVEVDSVARAEGRLSAAQEPGFDCILLDCGLPDANCHQALARCLAHDRRIPVVMITRGEDAETVVRLLSEGAADHIARSALSGVRLREVVLRVTQAHRSERLRRFAEGRLAAQQALLLAVLDQMPAGVLITDAKGSVLFRNARFLSLVGEDLIDAGSLQEMARICANPGPEAPTGRESLVKALLTPDGSSTDFRLGGRDGRYVVRIQHGSVNPEASAGAPMAQVAVLSDVTDLLAAESYQQHIVAIATHDLRNPLSAITTNAAVLAREGEMSEEKRRKGATRILSSARRMTRMIEDLFDYTLATLGKGIPVTFHPTDLAIVAEEAAAEARAAFPEGKLELEISGDLKGDWDADRLHQVLQNLLGNAFKYGDPAFPVILRVRQEHVLSRRQGEVPGVIVEVVNRGTPIEPTLLPRIFDAYRRGGPDGQRSLGLGLYIARRILDAHQAAIAAISTHEGTCFRVSLPKRPDLETHGRLLLTPPMGVERP